MKKSNATKVGIFLICGVLLFAVGLFLIGNRNQIFADHYDIYTDFANVDTLVSGAKIRVSGMDAGQVSDIQIPKDPSGKFRLKLSVDKKFKDIIRKDSVASIETEGMVGNKFVNIEKGTNGSPDCGAGCTIRGEEPVEIGDLLKQGKNLVNTVQGTIQDVQHHADHAIDNFASVGGHVDGMIQGMRGNVERIASNGAHITNGVSQIVSNVQQGRGTIGKLLSDPKMANDVQAAVAQVKQSSTNIEQASANVKKMVDQFQQKKIPDEVQQTVANARDMSQQLKGAVSDFLTGPSNQKTADELRDTVENARRATRNLASDTEAIKHNFFLRGFFSRRGFYNLDQLNRTEYESSDFVKHPEKRIWLLAANLFSTNAKGAQVLTNEGQSELDEAVSQVSDELPNNPLMVEGYADAGSPAQQYLASMQRAQEVKKYLESHFKLKPNLVGTIAMEDKPPKPAGIAAWSGVCLSLVVSRD